jgi:hypothetical protein
MRAVGKTAIQRWDDQPLRRKGLVVIAIPLLMLLAILPSFLIEQQQLSL